MPRHTQYEYHTVNDFDYGKNHITEELRGKNFVCIGRLLYNGKETEKLTLGKMIKSRNLRD
jgi:predicted GNAT family N-acyltransferase